MTTANFSQVGLEVWVVDTPVLQTTQVGLEVWASTSTGSTTAIATQVGLEVWVPVVHSSFTPPPYLCWIE